MVYIFNGFTAQLAQDTLYDIEWQTLYSTTKDMGRELFTTRQRQDAIPVFFDVPSRYRNNYRRQADTNAATDGAAAAGVTGPGSGATIVNGHVTRWSPGAMDKLFPRHPRSNRAAWYI